MGNSGSKGGGGGGSGSSRGDICVMILGFLVLQVEKVVILPTIFVIKGGYILIKEELMVATIEQTKSVPQVVAILQEIVIAGEGKEEEEVAALVVPIGKVEVAKIPYIQANNTLINL
jgi:hypothetical protein